jgi:hypothetical protein
MIMKKKNVTESDGSIIYMSIPHLPEGTKEAKAVPVLN